MLVDINQLKRINTQWGHRVGGKVLISIIDIIQQSIRSDDTLVRLEGEVFGLLFTELNGTQAKIIVKCMCKNVEPLTGLSNRYDVLEQMIISIGTVLSTSDTHSISFVMAEADKTLREAKSEGGSRMIIHYIQVQKYSQPYFLCGFYIQFITITPKFPLPNGTKMSIISAPVSGRNRTLSGFLISLAEGVLSIMKLHHGMLRHFITVSIVVLTSSFPIFEFTASDRAMGTYLRCIVQRADSFLLHDRYQNQNVAVHVVRAPAIEQSEVPPEQRRAICEAFEFTNNTHDLNLTVHRYPGLRDILQTTSTDYDTTVEIVAPSPTFNQTVEGNRHQDDCGSGPGMAGEKFHYHLDLNDRCVYFYEPVNVEYFVMSNWSFLQSGSIGIDRKDVEKVFAGRTVLSSIYQDQRTKQDVVNLLTPVYVAGQLKGIVLLGISKDNLRNIFYTHDRPLLWRFLNVTLTDTDSGHDIIINQGEDNLFQYINYVHDLSGGIRVSLSIDILYFITSSWKSALFWVLTALILLSMVRMHPRLYQNVSRENISDAMTGLYNRRILTPEPGQRLQRLAQSDSSMMFIVIDMGKLEQINDTFGRQEGDLAITLLVRAVKQSIHKSDYTIRLDGDESYIILVDSTPQIAAQLPERTEECPQHITPQREIGFSPGICMMKENDMLYDMYKASDERLYVNKQNRNSRS